MFGFNFYLNIRVFRNLKKKPKSIKRFVIQNIMLGTIYEVLYFPTLILYFTSFNTRISSNTGLSWLSYFSAILNITPDFFLVLSRIIFKQAGFFCLFSQNNNLPEDQENSSVSISMIPQKSKNHSLNKKFEELLITKFMREIFIGICQNICEMKKINLKPIFRKKECYSSKTLIINNRNVLFKDPVLSEMEDFKINFTTYGQEVFKRLIMIENFNESNFLESLLPSKNESSISESQGKSGNFFISTDDNKFILKTISNDEVSLIKNAFLKKYYLYLNKNKESLLSRIYGLFTIKHEDNNVNIILMRNCVGSLKNNITCRYDLKGSSLNRDTKVNIDNIQDIVMKDNNFLEIEKYLQLSQELKEKLRLLCYNDSQFLLDIQIMDYSLLVIKISLNTEEYIKIFEKYNVKSSMVSETSSKRSFVGYSISHHLFPSVSKNFAYIFAIIDYFQLYNFNKYLETRFKYFTTHSVKFTDISSVPPDIYMKRFNDFIEKITEVDVRKLSGSAEK